ncbi:undecaprenyldiphospho-muramoylpentapeptide beta-N-acetylglucosaminyltransferase [Halofilum ochraceum]|uniref:undecaprenyldiphospho-muramoylpentapeptide beta-N-acetylglucosaminyltransferase n=1 Tax=Halofilum ochraceum TaxID=1611323 RepID=UPI0008D8D824
MMGPVLIAAGGTGGHVFPALAVAHELRARSVPVVWLGTRAGLEARLVPAAGIDMEWLDVGGVRGKGLATRLRAPFALAHACWQAWRVLRRRRPRALLGMGGFVAGPGGLVAPLARVPLVVHEQNAVAGLTNRILARFARRVLEAMPGTFPTSRAAVHTGNPVRADIAALPAPADRFAGRTGALRLLVLGGSQGARALNERLPQALAQLPAAARPAVHHQCGARHIEAARDAYAAAGVDAEITPFIEDMASAYGAADLVIGRAGAMSVWELAAAGVGALLVPYPHAVDDHQTVNARWLADAGAAVVVQERELDVERLTRELTTLLGDRATLADRAERARALARPDAARTVADIVEEVAR